MTETTETPLQPKRQSAARLALIILLGLLGLWIIHAFLPAVIWAVVIAVAVDPLVQRAERRFPRPNLVAAAFTLGFALIVLAPIAIGIAQAAQEARDVAIWVKDAQHYGVPPPGWLANLPFSAEAISWWRVNLSDPAAAHHHFETLSHSLLGAQARLLGFGLGLSDREGRTAALSCRQQCSDHQGNRRAHPVGRPGQAGSASRRARRR